MLRVAQLQVLANGVGEDVEEPAKLNGDTGGPKMKKVEKREIKPKCPHCEARLENLVQVKGGWFADHRVYCCPECEKIVGVNFNLP
jgi:hypothetical protein